nr:immunoglobulin light chain junction region [Macaca mulatta]MOV99971.1 immunoglobulin light chain junction region [Macaca mulatta]MOW01978.1 immunoglobulin light chain junction region [Macaca mulatta]MOW16485.1 immunoglobulin light chain junction region [Macaca mulatta]MOW18565.1 immunoglobulin light chain junction region [Macaca mulatta]
DYYCAIGHNSGYIF